MTENSRIEFKSKLTDDLEKEVVAFLNAEGGVVYIGRDETKAYKLNNIDELQLKIKDRLKHNISPSILGLFDIALEEFNGEKVINIIVASGSEKPYYIRKKGMSEKGCFIRIGSSSEPMNAKMIEELFSKRVRTTLRNIVSPRQDLTFEQLHIYYSSKGYKLNKNFAKNLELLTDEGKYNYIAYLLADENALSIKVAKYKGTDRVELIENNEYGYCSLIKATKAVLDKLDVENTTFAKITPKERIEKTLWDKVAIKEAVINAIIHNDYTNEIPPKFEIFDDRLEITSAGGLPLGLSREEFFSGVSNPRNREIMRVYKDLKMVEQLGSGIPRILRAYSKESFVFMPNFTRMVFYKSGAIGGAKSGAIGGAIDIQSNNKKIYLTDRQREIIDLIKQNPKIGYRSIAAVLDINPSAVLKHLENLKKLGVIERIGGTRGYWKINL